MNKKTRYWIETTILILLFYSVIMIITPPTMKTLQAIKQHNTQDLLYNLLYLNILTITLLLAGFQTTNKKIPITNITTTILTGLTYKYYYIPNTPTLTDKITIWTIILTYILGTTYFTLKNYIKSKNSPSNPTDTPDK